MKGGAAAVYYHLSKNGECLYVGATACPGHRMTGHCSASHWVTQVESIKVVWFATREEALAFEAAEIARLKPANNKEWRRSRKPKPMNALSTYLRDHEITQKDFASKVGVTQATVSRLASGSMTPSLGVALRIASSTNGTVPVSAWSIEDASGSGRGAA